MDSYRYRKMFEHYDVDSLTDYIDIEFEANEEVYYEELLTLNNLHVLTSVTLQH